MFYNFDCLFSYLIDDGMDYLETNLPLTPPPQTEDILMEEEQVTPTTRNSVPIFHSVNNPTIDLVDNSINRDTVAVDNIRRQLFNINVNDNQAHGHDDVDNDVDNDVDSVFNINVTDNQAHGHDDVDNDVDNDVDSVKIKYSEEYDDRLKLYISDILNMSATTNVVLETWTVLWTHMIVEILSHISKTRQISVIDPQFLNLRPGSVSLKLLYINELFIDNYFRVYNDINGITKLALHPNANIKILRRYNTTIFCHIYANEGHNEISIDFYNTGDIHTFNTFFNVFNENMYEIIKVYANKLNFYYIFIMLILILTQY
jgi:hypothetical protein